jgi:DNA-directed RNA polymerase specialized sigma24 family protein
MSVTRNQAMRAGEGQDENDGFHTTRWTRVCRAKASSEEGRRALAELCEAYYEPVVTFLRFSVRDEDRARDFGHSFFVQILDGRRIDSADPERGRFRSFLLGAVKHFLANHYDASLRLKRGGGQRQVSLDDPEAMEVRDQRLSPDAAFERQWALTVLARGMAALRAECDREGKAALFDAAKPLLTGDAEHGGQEALAAACGLSAPAFRMAASRLRKRLRDHVKAEVAGTLEDPSLVQEEIHALFAALGS